MNSEATTNVSLGVGPGGAELSQLEAVMDEVIAATEPLPATVWGFGVGGFLSALLRAGVELNRPHLLHGVRQRVEPALNEDSQPTDHLIPVDVLLHLQELDPAIDTAALCARWARTVMHAARPAPDQPRVHRPDLDAWHSTIWVDCLHTDGPGLAILGHHEEAVEAVSEYAAVLQRSDGLFQHGYDVIARSGNDVGWGRGQAWALQGLLGTLAYVADDGLRARLDQLLSALAEHEQDGRWRTVVDDPAAPIEHSVAAYIAWLVPRAVALGLANEEYRGMADRARRATLASLKSGVLACSDATPVGPAEGYLRRGTGAHPWGQAPVLHLLLNLRRQALETEGSA